MPPLPKGLYLHKRGYYCATIAGKKWNFGRDRTSAVAAFLSERAYIKAYGKRAPVRVAESPTGRTLGSLCELFLDHQRQRVKAGDLTEGEGVTREQTCARLISWFDADTEVAELGPEVWAAYRVRLADEYAPSTVASYVSRDRQVFRWAYDEGIIDKPPRFGASFRAPREERIRAAAIAKGEKVITPEQWWALEREASTHMRAFLWLGINCAFGATDFGTLEPKAVDLDRMILNFPRAKKSTPRLAALWPETAEAMNEARSNQPPAATNEARDRWFRTRTGRVWKNEGEPNDQVMPVFIKLAGAVGHPKVRPSWLKHTFETEALKSRDDFAVDLVRGHKERHIRRVYRHRIDDPEYVERVRAVTDRVRTWLWAGSSAT
ncbi:MAG: hypothetical protein AAF532_16565 [Planctomycetota bacterium]